MEPIATRSGTKIFHDDHVGYLQPDGSLVCETYVKHDPIPDLGPEEKRCLPPEQCGAPSPTESKSAESSQHLHGPDCGHPMIQHNGHTDYLVGDELHHQRDGHCDFHGRIRRVPVKSQRRGGYTSLSDDDIDESFAIDPMLRRSNATWNESLIKKPKPWYKDRDGLRFNIMFFFTGGYFFVELIWGLKAGSLALVADAMHMLSDVVALVIGFYSIRATRRRATDTHTYGWARMEVVGGLMNGAFLLAICLTIAMESVQRFMEGSNETLEENAQTLIIVASVGLAINVFGMFLFGHGHHGHSHGGGHGHSHGGPPPAPAVEDDVEMGVIDEWKGDARRCTDHASAASADVDDAAGQHDHSHGGGKKKGKHQISVPTNLNMKGVFLHVLGDALGSVAVIVSGAIIEYTSFEKRHLADPICSLIITALLLYTTVPLVIDCVHMLLHRTPPNIRLGDVRSSLLGIKGVQEIHDLHIWQLNTEKTVASMHAIVDAGSDWMKISDTMKLVLHKLGIHATTIQPEFLPRGHVAAAEAAGDLCLEPVCDDIQDCVPKACCAPAAITTV